MKHPFIKLIQKILLLLVILFVLDRGLGFYISKLYYSQKQGDDAITTYAVNKAKEDVLIFGTSRAAHHYVASIIRDSTRLTAYNLGRDGTDFDYQYAAINAALIRYTPKVIIIDLNNSDLLAVTPEVRDRKGLFMSMFVPQMHVNKYIDSLIHERDPIEYYKAKLISLYAFNSSLSSIIQHKLGVGQKNKFGYEPLFGSKSLKGAGIRVVDNRNYREDETLKKKFEEVVAEIEKRKIQLYVIVSPALLRYKYTPVPFVNNVLSKYGLKVINFQNDLVFDDKTLYHNDNHLNDSGAKLFTQVLLRDNIKIHK
ncbi:MAG TPA: hypothetical protein VIM55_18810 [Mucilaginibacter sp.]